MAEADLICVDVPTAEKNMKNLVKITKYGNLSMRLMNE